MYFTKLLKFRKTAKFEFFAKQIFKFREDKGNNVFHEILKIS